MADTYNVTFSNVGPRHLTWTEPILRPLTIHALTKAVKKRKALGSRDIEFSDNGGIYVGMFRKVGEWRIEESVTADAVGQR